MHRYLVLACLWMLAVPLSAAADPVRFELVSDSRDFFDQIVAPAIEDDDELMEFFDEPPDATAQIFKALAELALAKAEEAARTAQELAEEQRKNLEQKEQIRETQRIFDEFVGDDGAGDDGDRETLVRDLVLALLLLESIEADTDEPGQIVLVELTDEETGALNSFLARAGFENLSIRAVPEPSGAVLLLMGLGALLVFRRRRQ